MTVVLNIMHRILIDGRFIGVGESISRYTLEILQGILKLDKKNRYTLLMRPQGKKEISNFFNAGLKKIQDTRYKIQNDHSTIQPFNHLTIDVLDIPHYSLPEQTRLLKYLNKNKFDLVHFTQFNHPIRYKGKYVISVHDLTLLGHLHRMNPLKRLGFKGVMSSAIKDSSQIITISNYSKKDIVETYKIDPKKISVTYLGVDNKFNPEIRNENKKLKSFKDKYKIAGDYILYTGMWKKHKNLLRMLKAFEKVKLQYSNINSQINSKSKDPKKLPASAIQLILVGKIDHEEPEVLAEISRINKAFEAYEAREAIITTGFIDEEELPISYAGALFYIIPSLSEGFGLPPLEAMACGTPVLSSDVSAMPEILGDAPLYFDPYKVEDIAKKIEMAVSDSKLRVKLSKQGIEHAKKYNWQKTAKETLDVYLKMLKA